MPSSTLFLGVGAVLSALSGTVTAATYEAVNTYDGRNWLDGFHFSQDEFNQGFVEYVSETEAIDDEFYYTDGTDVVFGVDGVTPLNWRTAQGRKSVRMEGNTDYNKGLFVLDVKQMPAQCGMWPAFWSLGREPWPVKGEIDIIEGVNGNTHNKYVLHTSDVCTVNGLGQSNPQLGTDCSVNAGAAGCDVDDTRINTFGSNFNQGNGGYYVMEWTSEAIKTWFFPRGQLPPTLSSAEPDSSLLGVPAASFQGNCDIDARFKDHRFIFTQNFCGEWAGNAYGTSGCPQYSEGGVQLGGMDSCKKHVAEHPTLFAGTAWKIGSFKIYQKKVVSSSSSSSVASSSSATSSASSSASSSAVTSSASSSSVASSSSIASSSSVSASSASSSSVSVSAVSSSSVSISAVSSSSVSASVASGSSSASSSRSASSVASSSASSVGSPSSRSSSSSFVRTSSIPAVISSSTSSHFYGNFSSSQTSFRLPPRASSSGHVYGVPSSKVYYGDDSPYPRSSSVKNYGPGSPETTSKPVYGNGHHGYVPPKTTITTTYTSTYVDICETGYTTITTTYVVPYCPTPTPEAVYSKPGYVAEPPVGWHATAKTYHDYDGVKTVTVTVPYSKYPEAPKATPDAPKYDGAYSKVPAAEPKYSAKPDAPVYGGDKPAAPVYDGAKPSYKPYEPVEPSSYVAKPVVSASYKPGSYGGSNTYVVNAVGGQATPTKAGYAAPAFTGAAPAVRAGGIVAALGAAAAFML